MTGAEWWLMLFAAEWSALLWAVFAVGGLLLAVGGGRILWQHWCDALKLVTHRAGGVCPCLACSVLDDGDDLMDVADSLFDSGARPVNEPRPDRWGSRNARNRGAWFDRVSRAANTQNARWITGRQLEQAGRTVAAEFAEFLADPDKVAEVLAEEPRRPGETTGEIRRGDPGQ